MNPSSSLPATIETQRLLLRRWRESDLMPFAELAADPVVMEYFPKVLSTEESIAAVRRFQQHFADHGFGFWAVEFKGVDPFIGFIGMVFPRFEAHFTPCVEIGWRLKTEHWGQGLATEGARGALEFGFQHLNLAEIVSFTTQTNLRSRRVMEKIGMTHSPADDFDHPNLPPEHPFSRHVLYRIARPR